MTKASLSEIKKMKDRKRDDASEGFTLPKGFWKTAKVVYSYSSKEAVKVRYDADMLK